MTPAIPVPCFSELPATHLDVVLAAARAVVAGRRIILLGPPGTGKTMVARRLAPLLELDDHARRWLDAEYEGTFGADRARDVVTPFRAPHHTCSALALVGQPYASRAMAGEHLCSCKGIAGHHFHQLPRAVVGRAGEVQLARFGVLMLDELVEFSGLALSTLREKLDSMGETAPRIVATSSLCACGWAGVVGPKTCSCGDELKKRWRQRLETACDSLKIAERVDVPYVDLRTVGNADARCPTTSQILTMIKEGN